MLELEGWPWVGVRVNSSGMTRPKGGNGGDKAQEQDAGNDGERPDGDTETKHNRRKQRRTAKPENDGDEAATHGKDGNDRKGENNGDEAQNKKLGLCATPIGAMPSPAACPRKGVLESVGWIPVGRGQADGRRTDRSRW